MTLVVLIIFIALFWSYNSEIRTETAGYGCHVFVRQPALLYFLYDFHKITF